jgi:hypothetical protein
MDAVGNVWGVHVTTSKNENHAAIHRFASEVSEFLHRILSSHYHHAAFRSIVLEWIFVEIDDDTTLKRMEVMANGDFGQIQGRHSFNFHSTS